MARLSTYLLPTASLLAVGLLLGGCGIVGEERAYYMKREWERFKGPAWRETGAKIGFDQVLPTARQKETANEKEICLHTNGSQRFTIQDGVNDKIDYRRCVLAPYQTEAGSRIAGRPDGVRTFE